MEGLGALLARATLLCVLDLLSGALGSAPGKEPAWLLLLRATAGLEWGHTPSKRGQAPHFIPFPWVPAQCKGIAGALGLLSHRETTREEARLLARRQSCLTALRGWVGGSASLSEGGASFAGAGC